MYDVREDVTAYNHEDVACWLWETVDGSRLFVFQKPDEVWRMIIFRSDGPVYQGKSEAWMVENLSVVLHGVKNAEEAKSTALAIFSAGTAESYHA